MTKTEFQREERYLVFKISDVIEHLTTTEALQLARLYEIQRVGRKEAGKSELECVVVEKDWPEYEPTWKAIEARVSGAQLAPNAVAYLDLGVGGYMDFSREDLEAVADGLDGYEKTVNVGNVTGGGDDHLESTTAYAARFIRAMLAATEAKP